MAFLRSPSAHMKKVSNPHMFSLIRIGLVLLLATVTLLPTYACFGNTSSTSISNDWYYESDDWDVVLSTTDLGIGTRRFAFVLSGEQGLVRLPALSVKTFFLEASDKHEVVEEKVARFYPFPQNLRGLYATNFAFDYEGQWRADITVPHPNGKTTLASVYFTVNSTPVSLDVGEFAPQSTNRTIRDVNSVSELTTGSFYNINLYQQTIKDALQERKPVVVVFASPAFCTNAVCGPQVEVASDLSNTYKDKVAFIHIDIYQNPNQIQGDLTKGIKTPILKEWGVTTADEWTFVINSQGRITASFENFAPLSELNDSIKKLM